MEKLMYSLSDVDETYFECLLEHYDTIGKIIFRSSKTILEIIKKYNDFSEKLNIKDNEITDSDALTSFDFVRVYYLTSFMDIESLTSIVDFTSKEIEEINNLSIWDVASLYLIANNSSLNSSFSTNLFDLYALLKNRLGENLKYCLATICLFKGRYLDITRGKNWCTETERKLFSDIVQCAKDNTIKNCAMNHASQSLNTLESIDIRQRIVNDYRKLYQSNEPFILRTADLKTLGPDVSRGLMVLQAKKQKEKYQALTKEIAELENVEAQAGIVKKIFKKYKIPYSDEIEIYDEANLEEILVKLKEINFPFDMQYEMLKQILKSVNKEEIFSVCKLCQSQYLNVEDLCNNPRIFSDGVFRDELLCKASFLKTNRVSLKSQDYSSKAFLDISYEELELNAALYKHYKNLFPNTDVTNFLLNKGLYVLADLVIELDFDTSHINLEGLYGYNIELICKRIIIANQIDVPIFDETGKLLHNIKTGINFITDDCSLDEYMASSFIFTYQNSFDSAISNNKYVKYLDNEYLLGDNYFFGDIVISRLRFLKNLSTYNREVPMNKEEASVILKCLFAGSPLTDIEIEEITRTIKKDRIL